MFFLRAQKDTSNYHDETIIAPKPNGLDELILAPRKLRLQSNVSM
jgi:hypothetical protein